MANVLPKLEAVYNRNKIKPRVLFYEGLDRIKKIYEDTIKEKPDEILEWNTSDFFKAFPGFPKEFEDGLICITFNGGGYENYAVFATDIRLK